MNAIDKKLPAPAVFGGSLCFGLVCALLYRVFWYEIITRYAEHVLVCMLVIHFEYATTIHRTSRAECADLQFTNTYYTVIPISLAAIRLISTPTLHRQF